MATQDGDRLLQEALRLAGLGYRVLPNHALLPGGACTCRRGEGCPRGHRGKHPRIGEWQVQATCETETIRGWWGRWPGTNIGILCDGHVVLDIDPRHGGDGSLEQLVSRYGELPETVTGRTGGGGSHLLFRAPDGLQIRNTVNLAPGIDVRATGGQIVAPPSLHESGAYYEWAEGHAPGEMEPAPLPVWVLALLDRPAQPARQALPTPSRVVVPGDVGDKILRRAVARAAPGSGDDSGLWMACQLRDNDVTEGEALALLSEYAVQATADPSNPFTERDTVRWWKSAQGRPAREAWTAGAPAPTLRGRSGSARIGGADGDREEAVAEREQPPVDLVHQPLTDLGNAERLLALHGRDVRYVPPWRAWIAWNGHYWERDGDGAVYRLAVQTVRMMAAQFELASPKGDDPDAIKKAWRAHVKSSESHMKLRLMMESASQLDGVPVRVDALDQHPHLLPVTNGTVDLRTGELGPHLREHLLTHIVPLAYEPEAVCPAWDRFMGDIFAGKSDLIDWVWRCMGYCLTGDVTERVFFILWGAGSNGKSTLLEAFSDMLGNYAACIDPGVLMEQRNGGSAGPEIAQLPGRRFVYTGETAKGRRLNEDRIKRLAGADTIQACAKYEAPVTFRPQFKVWMATNHMPEIKGTDLGIWDRIRLLPFLQRFSSDPLEIAEGAKPKRENVRAELLAEAPGALARMVRGAVAFHKDGLGIVDDVRTATARYRGSSDVIGAFVAERCETASEFECRANDLWASFRRWAEESNEEFGTQKAFGTSLAERGFVSFDRGRSNKAHWRGLRLLPTDDSSEPEYEPGELL